MPHPNCSVGSGVDLDHFNFANPVAGWNARQRARRRRTRSASQPSDGSSSSTRRQLDGHRDHRHHRRAAESVRLDGRGGDSYGPHVRRAHDQRRLSAQLQLQDRRLLVALLLMAWNSVKPLASGRVRSPSCRQTSGRGPVLFPKVTPVTPIVAIVLRSTLA